MPRPTMRCLAATVLASAVLTGGLAAGAGTASAVGSLVDGSGSVGVGLPDETGSVSQVPVPVAVAVGGIVHFIFVDVLGFPEPGTLPGQQ
ncbi:hypothetical protein ACGFIU_20750 [Rhodococcus oryzae]|uniref:hypothetical protein n=1 Tax=Rhodococcus oryzae TaxID=2571143 RepID=UPI00371C3492